MEAALEQAGLNVGQMIRNGFEAELRRARLFARIVPAGGDVQIELGIRSLILTPRGCVGFCVELLVSARLVKRDGAVVWETAFASARGAA